jgi:ParB family chromosome partitioning protein
MSVRDAEALVDGLKKQGAGATPESVAQASPKSQLQSRLQSLAQSLTRHWSTRVEIKGTERRGKIVLHYANRQELDRLLAAMQNEGAWQGKQT